MKLNLKNCFKLVAGLVIGITSVYSLYKLWQLAKQRDVFSVAQGFFTLNDTESALVDISGKGVKFLSKNDRVGQQAFDDYLSNCDYRYVGSYGKSRLYNYEGEEVVVKSMPLFSQYCLHEVFNQDYFEVS